MADNEEKKEETPRTEATGEEGSQLGEGISQMANLVTSAAVAVLLGLGAIVAVFSSEIANDIVIYAIGLIESTAIGAKKLGRSLGLNTGAGLQTLWQKLPNRNSILKKIGLALIMLVMLVMAVAILVCLSQEGIWKAWLAMFALGSVVIWYAVPCTTPFVGPTPQPSKFSRRVVQDIASRLRGKKLGWLVLFETLLIAILVYLQSFSQEADRLVAAWLLMGMGLLVFWIVVIIQSPYRRFGGEEKETPEAESYRVANVIFGRPLSIIAIVIFLSAVLIVALPEPARQLWLLTLVVAAMLVGASYNALTGQRPNMMYRAMRSISVSLAVYAIVAHAVFPVVVPSAHLWLMTQEDRLGNWIGEHTNHQTKVYLAIEDIGFVDKKGNPIKTEDGEDVELGDNNEVIAYPGKAIMIGDYPFPYWWGVVMKAGKVEKRGFLASNLLKPMDPPPPPKEQVEAEERARALEAEIKDMEAEMRARREQAESAAPSAPVRPSKAGIVPMPQSRPQISVPRPRTRIPMPQSQLPAGTGSMTVSVTSNWQDTGRRVNRGDLVVWKDASGQPFSAAADVRQLQYLYATSETVKLEIPSHMNSPNPNGAGKKWIGYSTIDVDSTIATLWVRTQGQPQEVSIEVRRNAHHIDEGERHG